MGRQAPAGAARHPHELARDGAGQAPMPAESEQERAAADATRHVHGRAASATSWSRPRGRRRSATPCWTHPSPWRPGCSTTTPTATRRSPAPSSTAEPAGNLTRDHIVDNITLYWLTGTGASAARSYWESGRGRSSCRGPGPSGGLGPGRLHHVPRRDLAAPRSWVETAYPNLIYFNEVDKGGHFAAWEEPRALLRGGPRGVPVTALARGARRAPATTWRMSPPASPRPPSRLTATDRRAA